MLKNNKFLFIFILSLVVLINPNAYAEEVNDLDFIEPSEILLVQNPKTVKEFERVLLFMVVTDTYEFHIPYSNNQVIMSNVDTALQNVSIKYPEYFGAIDRITTVVDMNQGVESLVIELVSDEFTKEQLAEYKKVFFNEAKKAIDSLKTDNIITDDMNDYDKAKKVYEWIAINNAYDESLKPISQTGYAVLVNKTSVCTGYTAANNLMLKMLGVKDVVGVYGDDGTVGHIWTKANLDGNIVYIDSTWSDPTPDLKGYCDFKFFAVDREFLKKEHKESANLVWKDTY